MQDGKSIAASAGAMATDGLMLPPCGLQPDLRALEDGFEGMALVLTAAVAVAFVSFLGGRRAKR